MKVTNFFNIKNNIIVTNNYNKNDTLKTYNLNFCQLNKFSEYFTKFVSQTQFKLNSIKNIKNIQKINRKIDEINYLILSYQYFTNFLFIYCPIHLENVSTSSNGYFRLWALHLFTIFI